MPPWFPLPGCNCGTVASPGSQRRASTRVSVRSATQSAQAGASASTRVTRRQPEGVVWRCRRPSGKCPDRPRRIPRGRRSRRAVSDRCLSVRRTADPRYGRNRRALGRRYRPASGPPRAPTSGRDGFPSEISRSAGVGSASCLVSPRSLVELAALVAGEHGLVLDLARDRQHQEEQAVAVGAVAHVGARDVAALGSSSLITSAPRNPRICAQAGPA